MEQSIDSVFRSNTKEILGVNIRDELHMTRCGQSIALVSGYQIAIYNPKLNEQTQFIFHSSTKISCIAATIDGTKLAVAQSMKGSVISIYDLTQGKDILKPQYTLKGHRLGVSLMAWSPNNRYLVSASNEDGGLFVWQDNIRISQNKIAKKINKIIFTADQNMVTVGVKHFKLWPFNQGIIIRNQMNDCWMMDARSIGLGKKLEEKQFVNVTERMGSLIAITSDGVLCLINGEKCQRAVDLFLTNSRGLDVFKKWALCGGQNSTIKIVDIETLKLVSTFPKPPPIGKQNLLPGEILEQNEVVYSSCIGIKVINQNIVTLYETGQVFVWEFQNSNIISLHSLMGHSKQLICLSLLEEIPNQMSFFATSSNDKTIRLWHLYGKYFNDKQSVDLAEVFDVKRNAYCKYLTRVIYCEEVIERIKATGSLMVATSSQNIYVYSLESYQLLYQHSIEDNLIINCIQIQHNELYVGLSDHTITTFTISETMLKSIKVVQSPIRAETISILDKNMIIKGKDSMIVVDTSQDKIIKQEKEVIGLDLVGQKEIYYIKRKNLHVFNLLKKKEKEPIPLEKQFSTSSIQLRVIDNFILTLQTLNNSTSHLRVWNHEGAVIHERVLNDVVEGIQLTKDGNCIIGNRSGSILVQQFIYRQKFMQVEKQFKQYFNEHDLSWSAGSIWTSQALKNNNYQGLQNLLIKQTQSKKQSSNEGQIESQSSNDSPGLKIPYKNNDHRTSLFIPSQICQQMNNVLENVNKIQKKFQMKSPRGNKQDQSLKTFYLTDDHFEGFNLDGDGKMVESIVSKPKMNNFVEKDKQKQEEKIPEKKKEQFNKSKIKESDPVNQLYQILTQQPLESKKEFVASNEQKLRTIYSELHQHFGSNNQNTINQIQKISKTYLTDLKTLLEKL